MKASDRRRFRETKIMVAENVEQRCIIAMPQGRKILRREISAGQYQLNAWYCRATVDRLKQVFGDDIRYAEDFHK
jgi:hypothetical protein